MNNARLLPAVGSKFGRWTVVRSFGPSAGGASRADVECECGQTTTVTVNTLRTGRSRSCGCFMREQSKAQLKVITTTHGLSKDPAYSTWKAMKVRCFNTRNAKFAYYGGRGITICAEWRNDFPAFLRHVGPRPSMKHQIDRWPNNDGNYEPGNVRWATAKEQANNRRPRRWGKRPADA